MKSLFSVPPDDGAFDDLMARLQQTLNRDVCERPGIYSDLFGNKLEGKVAEVLRECARGTCFEGTIELISGQRFPDIVVGGYYGVEVKTTKSNHWKSTGSSVAEGTRVEGVERVYMLFGKMCSPIEFLCKPYEECLSEVVVTHSPRYLIDMHLAPGATIFNKLGVSYDELRDEPNPIRTILNYYRSRLKKNEELWWLDNDGSQGTNLVIRMWGALSLAERKSYLMKGFVFFPEILSNRIDKFNRFAMWLATREGVVCRNVRDLFSAGGREAIVTEDESYSSVSKVIVKLYRNLSFIREFVQETGEAELMEYWGIDVREQDKWNLWCELAIKNLQTINDTKIPLENLIR